MKKEHSDRLETNAVICHFSANGHFNQTNKSLSQKYNCP